MKHLFSKSTVNHDKFSKYDPGNFIFLMKLLSLTYKRESRIIKHNTRAAVTLITIKQITALQVNTTKRNSKYCMIICDCTDRMKK